MPKSLPALIVAVLFLCCGLPSSSPAQTTPPVSTNLSWDHCAGDGRVADRSFACDDSTGSDDFFVSVVFHDSTRTRIVGLDCTIDITPVSTDLPDWWQLGIGGCRQNGVSADTGVPDLSPACTPWYQDVLVNSTILMTYHPQPDRLVLHLATALSFIPTISMVTLEQDHEYGLFEVHLSHRHATGASACAGCLVPTCLGVGKLTLNKYDQSNSSYGESFAGAGDNTITWQGAYVADYPTVPDPNGGSAISDFTNLLDCAAGPVPARNRTWGTIKTLYR